MRVSTSPLVSRLSCCCTEATTTTSAGDERLAHKAKRLDRHFSPLALSRHKPNSDINGEEAANHQTEANRRIPDDCHCRHWCEISAIIAARTTSRQPQMMSLLARRRLLSAGWTWTGATCVCVRVNLLFLARRLIRHPSARRQLEILLPIARYSLATALPLKPAVAVALQIISRSRGDGNTSLACRRVVTAALIIIVVVVIIILHDDNTAGQILTLDETTCGGDARAGRDFILVLRQRRGRRRTDDMGTRGRPWWLFGLFGEESPRLSSSRARA